MGVVPDAGQGRVGVRTGPSPMVAVAVRADDRRVQTQSPPNTPRRLVRSTSDRMVAGVAGGIAAYLDVDPVLVRIAFVLLTIAGGAGLLAYLVAWLLMPEEPWQPGQPVPVRARAGDGTPHRTLLLVGLGAVLLFVAADRPFFRNGGVWWALALLAVGLVLLRRHEAAPTPPPSPGPPPAVPTWDAATDPLLTPLGTPVPTRHPREPGVARWVLAGLAVLAGVWALVGWPLTTFLALGVLAAGVGAVAALVVRRPGGASLVVVAALLAGTYVVASAVDLPWHGGVGERTWRPAQLQDVRSRYRLGVGDLVVDLRDVAVPAGERRTVKASVGVGHVLVLVPDGATVRASAHSGIGQAALLGDEDSGVGADRSVVARGAERDGTLVVDVEAGIGQAEVRRVA